MKFLPFLILLLTPSILWAQKPKIEEKAEAAWVEPSSRTVMARIGIVTPSLDFSVEPIERLNLEEIAYQPSTRSKTSVGLAFGSLGLSLGLSNPVSNEDKNMYGESRVNDWQLRFYGKYATWDIIYQEYDGYYIDNTEHFDASRGQNDPRLQRPDIKNIHYGMQVTYVLKADEYNIGSCFDLGVRQIRSGGSLFLTGGFDHNRLSADSPIVPQNFRAAYDALGTLSKGTFNTVSGGGGYGHTWVRNSFYIGGIFGFTLGVQQLSTDSTPPPASMWNATMGTRMKLGTGYNGERMFWGFSMHYDENRMGVMDGILRFAATESALFWGFRFEAPAPASTPAKQAALSR